MHNINILLYIYIMQFAELLNDKEYDWATYFYKLESRKRSHLENVLLKSYNRIKGVKNIDMCCCDLEPIKDCGPSCCPQVNCFHCTRIIRICKDMYRQNNEVTLCEYCY